MFGSLKQARKPFASNMHHQDTMKTTTKSYLSVPFRRKFTVFFQNKIWWESFWESFLTKNFQRKWFDYHILKKNWASYHTIAQRFSRNWHWTWRRKNVQYSPMENTVFRMNPDVQNYEHVTKLKINTINPLNINQRDIELRMTMKNFFARAKNYVNITIIILNQLIYFVKQGRYK